MGLFDIFKSKSDKPVPKPRPKPKKKENSGPRIQHGGGPISNEAAHQMYIHDWIWAKQTGRLVDKNGKRIKWLSAEEYEKQTGRKGRETAPKPKKNAQEFGRFVFC